MNVNIATKMEGFYSLKVHGGKRGEIDFGTHKNLILDAGITRMLNGKNPLNYIHVGSGSSQPTAGQVQLDANFANTRRNQEITHGYVSKEDSESGKAYGYSRLEVQFDKGAAKGNISEIGVCDNNGGTPLWSRSLILDKSGNSTSITILDDEYLTVTYELRRHVSTETVTTTLHYDDDGEMKSVECSVVPSRRIDTGNGWASAGVTNAGNLKYQYLKNPESSTGTLKVDGNSASILFKYNVDQGNDIDLSGMTTHRSGGGTSATPIPESTTLVFNPPLRKTNEFELTIGVTVTIERA